MRSLRQRERGPSDGSGGALRREAGEAGLLRGGGAMGAETSQDSRVLQVAGEPGGDSEGPGVQGREVMKTGLVPGL